MAKDKLREELEAIREEAGGVIRAIDVLTFAKAHPDSELWKHFTWDDAIAGEKHRLNEARGIIRMNVFVIPGSKEVSRLYVSLEPDRQLPGGGYRSTQEVLTDADRRGILLRQALREIERWRVKYRGLRELASIFASLEEIEAIEGVNKDTLDVIVAEKTPSIEPASSL